MKSTIALANRFREVFLDGTWIANTNYKMELTGLSINIANAKVQQCNTIATLAQHIHYYVVGIKNVLQGGTLDIKDKYSFDFTPLQSQNEWEIFLSKFMNDAEEFAVLTAQLPDEKLNEVFVDERYGTYARNIDAMIEHAYYHLGQIVLIKKILAES